MQFGTFLLLQSPSARPSQEIFQRGVEITQAAEELGFRNMWLAEHHFRPTATCHGRSCTPCIWRIRRGIFALARRSSSSPCTIR